MRFAVNEINKQVNFSKAKKTLHEPVKIGGCGCGEGGGEKGVSIF